MRFERWLDEMNIRGQARNFFDESIMCFNVGAYRGALMLSMLGFQTIIKDRVLNASIKPPGLDTEQWDEIRENLIKPETWDTQVINLAGDKKPDIIKRLNRLAYDNISKVLALTVPQRKKFAYWLDLRNNSVHGKEEIVAAHVELFWHFIQENIGKFYVNGGVKGFIQNIQFHFDPYNGKAKDNFTSLLSELPTVVEHGDIKTIFSEIYNVLKDEMYYRDFVLKFWKEIYTSPDVRIREGFISYLEECDTTEFITFIVNDPNILSILDKTHKNLREMWLKRIETLSRFPKAFDEILVYLLESNKIEEVNRNHVWEQLAKRRLLNINFIGVISEALGSVLKKYGYFDYYYDYISDWPTHSYIQMQNYWYKDEYVFPNILRYAEMNVKVARTLTPAFKEARSTGTFMQEIEQVFAEKPEVYQRYKECCIEEGIEAYIFTRLEN